MKLRSRDHLARLISMGDRCDFIGNILFVSSIVHRWTPAVGTFWSGIELINIFKCLKVEVIRADICFLIAHL
jgi:hypothetical protein